jgi:type IV pilus assembly protein PilM
MGKVLSIVFNNHAVMIAQLAMKRKGVVVSRVLKKDLPAGCIVDSQICDLETTAKFLSDTLKFANIHTKKVIFSLPTDKVMSREVTMPLVNEEKTMKAIRFNAGDYFPIDLSEYVLSYYRIANTEQTGDPEEAQTDDNGDEVPKKSRSHKKTSKKKSWLSRMMVVAAPNDIVQSYYDLAKLAHLKVQSIDYMAGGIFQLASSQIDDSVNLVAYMDMEHTMLSIFNHGVMELQRNVDFGGVSTIQLVMDQYNIDFDAAEIKMMHEPLIAPDFESGDEITDNYYYLMSNIRRTIEYYNGRHPENLIEKVYLMGSGTSMLGLKEMFQQQLELPVESVTALKQVQIRDSVGVSLPQMMKFLDNIGAVIEPVGFTPKKLEQDTRRKLEHKAYRIAILLALFAAAVIVTLPATEYLQTAMDHMELETKLKQLEDVEPILQAYDQAASRYEDVQEVHKLSGTNNESLLEFINTFEQLRPSNMSIESFSCSNGQISITALADGKETVARLIQQLDSITNVSDVKVSSLSSSFDGGQETVSFSISCTLVNAGSMFPQYDTRLQMDLPLETSEEAEEQESRVTVLDE